VHVSKNSIGSILEELTAIFGCIDASVVDPSIDDVSTAHPPQMSHQKLMLLVSSEQALRAGSNGDTYNVDKSLFAHPFYGFFEEVSAA
jgi:hypothetical protein